MRFLGNIEAKVDAKGRAFLPAVFRKVLQASGEEKLMLRQHVHEKCIVVYPESVWNERIDMLRTQLSVWNKAQDIMFRQFTSQAEEVTLDGNGRLLISKRLLQAAGIQQSIRFIGNDDTIEIWAEGQLEETFLSDEEFSKELEKIMAMPV
jgi:MraZ protein